MSKAYWVTEDTMGVLVRYKNKTVTTSELSQVENDKLLLLQRFLKLVCLENVILLSVLHSERLIDLFSQHASKLNDVLDRYEIYIDCGID